MRFLIVLACISILVGCSHEPQPIVFGSDACSFCKMTIVDQRYGAEVVTTKGKVFKYDALECMINALCDNNENQSALLHGAYVIDFNNPGTLMSVNSSSFLFSESLPSPMGAYLTSFSSKSYGDSARQSFGGELYNWESVFLKVVGNRTCTDDK